MKAVRLSALRTGRLYPSGNIPGTHFFYRLKLMATMRPEELCELKISMTSSGIEPATFRLLAQCLNQPHHGVPHPFS
jgi:hypothetical protein